jgi:hypothetical protein
MLQCESLLLAGTELPFAAAQKYGRFLGYSGRKLLAVRISRSDHPLRNYEKAPRRWLSGARFKSVLRGGYFARLKTCSVGVPVTPVVASVNFNSSPVIAIAIFCSPPARLGLRAPSTFLDSVLLPSSIDQLPN